MKVHKLFVALMGLLIVNMALAASSAVYPVRAEGLTQSLNGEWSFKYIAGSDAGPDAGFSAPSFDVSAWKTIKVPSNWELQGFAEPGYDLKGLKDGLGLYRRTFRVPAAWSKDRRVCLRLEGVAFGFEAWVNGTKIGASSASAYNPNTFDITDALKSGTDTDNMLAVKVTTKPFGYEFDVNDDWALCGIYRDVTLFSVPTTHVQDVTTRTKLATDGAAELSVSVAVNQLDAETHLECGLLAPPEQAEGGTPLSVSPHPAVAEAMAGKQAAAQKNAVKPAYSKTVEIHAKLIAPDGATVREISLPRQTNGCYEAVLRVEKPQLWTAETPVLYRLQLSFSANGQPLQSIEERIGLREISIVDGVLRLNGRPIKLRGVNHHDTAPETGRAITEAEMRRDLDLMRVANINFIRTSHYPPNKRFIELCDEMGFYVMCEVAIGKGEEHLNDPAYRGNIVARVEPTVTRDKNRPSVIIWSIGNENPVTEVENEAGHLAKQLDPTRPICMPKIGSYFEKNYTNIPAFVDIYAPHYPVNATLRRFARSLERPVILTEYAHALGLATDRIQEQWEILQATPRFAGGAIWHFQDQGLLRTRETPVDGGKPTDLVWRDAYHCYDTHGNDGCDGIVYSDRTPQTDYWLVRKAYSPVQIAAASTAVKPGAQEASFTVENRYDFRALAGMKLAWSLQRNGAELQHGEVALKAAAHEKENILIPVNIPVDAADDVLALNVRCLDETGLQITERAMRLDLPGANRDAWLAALPEAGKPKVNESATEVTIEHARWILTVNRATGELSLCDRAGRVLVSGIYPHPGRKLTMTEQRSVGRNNTWCGSTLTKVMDPKVKVSREGATLRLAVSGAYPRPRDKKHAGEVKRSDEPLDQLDKPVERETVKGESLVGGYQADISPNGVITIRYDYVPTRAKGKFAEAGLSVVLPPGATEFRWIGQGPYAGYPGKDKLNEFGIFHLNRDDLRFQGNRRGTEVALLTTPAGAGVALVTAPADIAVERDGDRTLLSHNAVISGLGNKGTSPETFVSADEIPHVSGSFTLVPLDEKWPTALTRWFGTPSGAKDVFHPFYHSYDQ